MVDLVARYFLEHNRLVLPGVGMLSVTQAPAKADGGRQLVYPPRLQFQWNPQAGENEGMQALAGYVSRQTQWTEEESFDAIAGFCTNLTNELEEKGEFALNGIGKLVRISEENTGFVPDPVYDVFWPALEAPVVLRQGNTHPLLVGDTVTNTQDMQEQLLAVDENEGEGRWWIAALVVAVAGLALIAARLGKWL